MTDDDRIKKLQAQLESTTSAAGEGLDQVRNSLQTAYKDIRQALLDTKHKIAS